MRRGLQTEIVSPEDGRVRGWNHKEWGRELDVDQPLRSADPKNYQALVLPGGVTNPHALRMNPAAVAFVRSFFEDGKPVAAICHGPWMVILSGSDEGRLHPH
jgi:protease I